MTELNVNEENTLVPDVLSQNDLNVIIAPYTAADSDLQIGRGGVGGGHPDPEIRGAISKKVFFGPSGLSLV